MPKKTAAKSTVKNQPKANAKTSVKAKLKAVAPIKAAAKKKMKTKEVAPAAGMWKILEMKQLKQKQVEQNGRDVRPHAAHGGPMNPFARNTRFTKFAGPRRKVG